MLVVLSAILGLVVGLAMIVERSSFFIDWRNHLFAVTKQADYLQANLGPTFFLNTLDRGWFYPFFAFYAGSLYTATGTVAVLLGSSWAAYVGSYAFAAAWAFGGWLWIGRLAGLPLWLAVLPGAVFVSGAYYITNAYGRGAWSEFVASSFVVATFAGIWSNLTRPRLTPLSVLGLALPIAFVTGSHTITLVYAVPLVGFAAAVLVLLVWPSVRGMRRLIEVSAIVTLAAAVNGWVLVPLLAYRSTLKIQPVEQLRYREFDQLEVIFSLNPVNPYAHSTPELFVQAPVIPLIVAVTIVLAGTVLLPRVRLTIAVAALHLGFFSVLGLITGTAIWDWLPRELRIIQFPYRLNSYLLAAASGFVALAGIYVRHAAPKHRAGVVAGATLCIAVLAQVGLGQRQIWTAITYGPVEQAFESLDRLPLTWYEPEEYANVSAQNFDGHPFIAVDVATTDLNSGSVVVRIPPDLPPGLVRLNVNYSPFVASVPDLIVGRHGRLIVVSVPDHPRVEELWLGFRDTPATILGRWMSFGSVLGLVAIVLGKAGVRFRRPVPQSKIERRTVDVVRTFDSRESRGSP